MPIYQTTAFFECRGKGWTETWFRDSGSENSLAVLNAFDIGLWNKRALMLGKEAKIKATRTSFTGVLQDSRLSYAEIPGNPGFSAAPPQVTLLTIFYSGAATKRKFVFVRGIDDDAAMEGGKFTPGSAIAFQNASTSWSIHVISNSYGWLGIDTKIPKQLLDYVQTVDNRVQINLEPGAFPLTDVGTLQRVNIKKANGPIKSELNRRQVVFVLDQDSCVTASEQAVFPRTSVTPGILERLSFTLYTANLAASQKIGERRVGKALLEPVGRIRNRVRG